MINGIKITVGIYLLLKNINFMYFIIIIVHSKKNVQKSLVYYSSVFDILKLCQNSITKYIHFNHAKNIYLTSSPDHKFNKRFQ